jgi:predicted metal-dependent phosphoesterase TrpH
VNGPGTERRGRADLHIHTLASDGTASVAEVLDAVATAGALDVVAIADHERIDAAIAARHLAEDRGLTFEVVVGEEITTRGGHLLGLYLEHRVPPLKSLRWSIEAVHDQGGIAIPAHPLVPLHLSAQGWVLRGLLSDDNPLVHRDAHAVEAIGTAWTGFPGRSADDLRRAILAGKTTHHGTFHGSAGQLGVFGRQLRKRGRDAKDEVAGRIRRDGSGRDHGYPGSTRRPPVFDPLDGPGR